MSLTIRPVDFVADHGELLRVLERNLPDVAHEARLPWLYRDNPAGPARTWFLCDANGAAVGVTSLFPRAVWMNGEHAVCGQVGDFGVDLKFRSLGPAIKLQRATFEPVADGAMAFCYDCPPHERGMAMFHRLGLQENCRMQVYVKPLRTDRQLQRLLGDTAGRITARAANPLLRLTSMRRANSQHLECTLLPGDFGDEFSALDEAVQIPGSIRNRRSAEDLNWRFRRNPLGTFEILTVRRDGELLAYAVFAVMEDDAFVFDLFGRDLSVAGPALLDALTGILHRRPVQTVRALLTGDGDHAAIFRQAGFSFRGDAARVVAFSGEQNIASGSSLRNTQWHFQHSDVMA
jgi:hypothetical protein